MLVLTVYGAALAYAALNIYLLSKILPVPITLIPQTDADRAKMQERITA